MKANDIFFLSLIFLLASNCSTEDVVDQDSLPPVTMTGANTFGCKVGNKILVPKDGAGTFNAEDKGMILWSSPVSGEYLEIDVQDFKTGVGSVIIHIVDENTLAEGVYEIGQSNCRKGVDALDNNSIYFKTFDSEKKEFKHYCSFEKSGEIEILKYDASEKIISATFHAKLRNSNDHEDILELKQGRFDINWETLPYSEFK